MKTLLPFLLLTLLAAPSARAAGEEDKAGSGERFLESGGRGTIGDGSGGVAAGEGGSDRSALDLVNSPERAKGLKTNAPPEPSLGTKLDKTLTGGKGAVYGMAAGLVIGGVVGSIGGPAGTLGGAAGGAKLGAMAGAGVGFLIGYLLGGKKENEVGKAIESRQQQLDDLMKQ